MTSGNLSLWNNALTLSGDLIIKPSCTMTVTRNINVGGKIDIWDTGSFNMSGNYSITTNNLYNSGLLNLPSGITGSLTVANTYLQYSTGQLALHGGSLIMNGAYTGAMYAFGGTSNMSGGILQVTNNGMQVGASGFTFTGGTIKVGWAFAANNPSSFQANNGTLEMIGSLAATIGLGTGNYLPNLIINKTGSSGYINLMTDLTVKQNLTVSDGKIYCNHHILTLTRDLTISAAGTLYANNSDDVINIGGKWNNQGTSSNFSEGSGLVKFVNIANNTKQIDSNETFNNLIIDTSGWYVFVVAGKTITVSGNLDINSGRLQPKENTILNVSGNLSISGTSSYLDIDVRQTTHAFTVFVHGTCSVNGGYLRLSSINGNANNNFFTVDGDLTLTGGELYTNRVTSAVHGNFTTTSATNVEIWSGTLVNDAPYTGTWQLINCSWTTWGSVVEFTNKGLQFISGSDPNFNSNTNIRLGRGLYALTSGVLTEGSVTFEFIGNIQANINLGGDNVIPSMKISKTSAAVVLSTNAVVKDDLTIQSGSFNSNNYTLRLGGSWINNVGSSGYSSGTSEIIFDTYNTGKVITGDQTFHKLSISHTVTSREISFSSSNSSILNNLEINGGYLGIGNTATIQVNGNVSIAQDAELGLDGFQGTNYFHFNWGWGGYADGYFYLNNLNPGGANYNNYQTALLYLGPTAKGFLNGTVLSGGSPLAGAQVSLSDPLRSLLTDASGAYSLSPLDVGSYQLTAFKPGYRPQTYTVTVSSEQSTIRDFDLHYDLDPPSNVLAVRNGNSISLSWEAASQSIASEWISWADAAYSHALGPESAMATDIAQRWTQTDLLPYQGGTLTKVNIFPCYGNCVYTVKVWSGGNSSNPGTPVFSQVLQNPVLGQWNTVTLPTPVPVPAGGELWIGYHFNTPGGMPIGCDYGPTNIGTGNMINYMGNWITADLLNLQGNILIQGYIEYPSPLGAITGYKVHASDEPYFTPSGANLLGSTAGTSFLDTQAPALGQRRFYSVLTAAGNRTSIFDYVDSE